MQSTILFCLLALALFLVIVLGLLLWIEISEATIIQDEVAYQESEIIRLEGLVKRKNDISTLKHENIHLLTRVIRHTAYLKYEILRLRKVVRRVEEQQRMERVGESDVDEQTLCDTKHEEALSAHIQQQNTCIDGLNARIEELEKKHDEEKTERSVAESMKCALGQENVELKQTIAELRQSAQNSTQQRVEKGQTAVIQTLQNCIKTAARLSAEQTTKIQVLEERIAEKHAEMEEVAILTEEIARRSQEAYDALRRANRHYVKDLKKKWALAWTWAAGEMNDMKMKLAELTKTEDSVVSIAQIFEVDEEADGTQDMSMCSVQQEEIGRRYPPNPVKHKEPQQSLVTSIKLPWIASPSKLATRPLVRKIALSANPPDSPFAFATNSVQFAPGETKMSRDRAVKRLKMDRR
ncbi:hypothetical protein B0H16DRAFT_465124 [Mycena metata]|uniref:Uncharacterized protein n=1 Tax=Mycena metata TaxID=1033252 RepID=A0AAD7KCC9_9AGAR|nr:hypothetical protein B0H16DRAFT_465124 [Mycena metata]